jgi:hypothetical protein
MFFEENLLKCSRGRAFSQNWMCRRQTVYRRKEAKQKCFVRRPTNYLPLDNISVNKNSVDQMTIDHHFYLRY